MEKFISLSDYLGESPIYEMAAQITWSKQITEAQRNVLTKAYLSNQLNEEEYRLVNRIYYAISRGRIKLV